MLNSKITIIRFIITTLIAFLITSPLYAKEKQELLLGSVAMDIPAVMHKRLSPLTEYLEKTLDMPVSLKLSPNMGAAINDISEGNVDIAYLTPVAYLKANKKGNAQIIAKTVTRGKASFQLMIVVPEESNIRTINDLKEKTFAFGDKRALLQRAAVLGAGVSLDDLGSYEFIGHYDNIASAVMHGDFDAGILKDTMALKLENKGLRIIYSTPHLPPYNIAVSNTLSPKVREKIKAAFLSLDGRNNEHLKVIKALDKKYNGFSDTSNAEYDVIRDLIRPFNQ